MQIMGQRNGAQTTCRYKQNDVLNRDVINSFDCTNLKDEQKKAVTAFLQGKDAFVSKSLPTSSGKSLCFYHNIDSHLEKGELGLG
jgi:superfamily II DNA helicase RecQ